MENDEPECLPDETNPQTPELVESEDTNDAPLELTDEALVDDPELEPAIEPESEPASAPEPESAPALSTQEGREKPLGELLIEAKLITAEELEHALRVQLKLKRKKRVGRVLVELGYITDDAMRELLERYSRQVRLGDLLVEREFLTPTELERALEMQKSQPKLRLGQLLLKEKFLTEKTFCDALALYLNIERVIPDFKKLDWSLLSKVSLTFMEQNKILPYHLYENGLQVLVTESYDEHALSTLNGIFGGTTTPGLCTVGEIQAMLQYIRERPAASDVRPLIDNPRDESVAAMLDRFITEAIEMGASDVHIEPMENLTRVRLRIDGQLVIRHSFSRDKHKSLTARAKIISGADIAEQRNHQDGKAQVAFRGHPVDLRFSIYVTVHGECVVIRILNPVTNLMGLDSLGLSKYNYTRYADEVIVSANGIVLITGPTGSGKTTALYSTLQYQLEDGYKIVTVEDPVEYILPGLIQCSVDERVGRTFTSSLRHIMRQDPDIIVLGEMRDLESAEIAIHASLTGHKVYSTFHTEDATGALGRLVQMGIEKYMVSSTVLAVMAQRLVRRICSYCRETYVPSIKHLRRMNVSPKILKTHDFKRGRGCERCHSTGYSGRVPIQELLILDDRVRDSILRDASNFQIRDMAIKHAGMVTMSEDALFKIFQQETTFEEVVSHVPITTPPRDIMSINRILEA